MPSSVPYTHNSHHASRPSQGHNRSQRPATIAELAERALTNLWDPSKDLKPYLRAAEHYRKMGKAYTEAGDLESAFVEFAKAATVVLEKLPTHRDYHTLLNASQRHNLGLNGQDILDNLSALKPTLVERYERWLRDHPDETPDSSPRTPNPDPRTPIPRSNPHTPSFNVRTPNPSYPRTPTNQAAARPPDPSPGRNGYTGYSDSRVHEDERARQEAFRREDQGRQRRDDGAIEEEQRRRDREVHRRDEAVAAARRAAEATDLDYGRRAQENEYNRGRLDVGRDRVTEAPAVPGNYYDREDQDRRQQDLRRRDEDVRRQQEEVTRRRDEDARRQQEELQRRREEEARRQQEEMRRREEEIQKRRMEERRRQEQEGIVRRQQEAESALRTARQGQPFSMPVAVSSASGLPVAAPQPVSMIQTPRAPSQPSEEEDQPPLMPMPLESPTRYEEDTTDSETQDVNGAAAVRAKRHNGDNHHTPRGLARAPTYPAPITTTSPAPPDVRHFDYPRLMSQHQMKQGYVPSLQSMFKSQMKTSPDNATLLFVPEPAGSTPSMSLYPANALPQPSVPGPGPSGAHYGMPPHTAQYRPHQQYQHPQRYPPQQPQYPSYPGPTRPAPPLPAPPSIKPSSSSESRIIRAPDPRADAAKELKTVSLPRACLPRFLSIAALNTARDRETCGLLLGKDKGHKFMVTTLLIPKQHSTSDTCTMDEEELVLQFTEERSLITLGWIHTHPSQSCFMSSVDLHTHSGFQRMLPESFAVVCAPKHTPNFGIFRLTEPPGLQTILDCRAKEAFHPHPDVPIYTDADKGHVQMKDMSLEIVDLR